MKKEKNLAGAFGVAAAFVLIVGLLLYLAPFPQHIRVSGGAWRVDADSSAVGVARTYTVDWDLWRLHYVFGDDTVHGTVTLTADDGTMVLDHVELGPGGSLYDVGGSLAASQSVGVTDDAANPLTLDYYVLGDDGNGTALALRIGGGRGAYVAPASNAGDGQRLLDRLDGVTDADAWRLRTS